MTKQQIAQQIIAQQTIKNNKVRSWLSIICLGWGLVILSGCAVHKASFDCPDGKGMGCGSMIDVHQAIKNNSFESRVEERNHPQATAACISCQKTNLSTTAAPAQINIPSSSRPGYSAKPGHLNKSIVFRSQDQIMRIWFNSYFDQQNNFHDSQYIYTIIVPAQWIVNHKNELSL